MALERQEARHVQRLKTAWAARNVRMSGKRRGFAGQRGLRQMERAIRLSALAFRRWVRRQGLTREQAAELLRIRPQTLAGWNRSWAKDRMRIRPRGRPPDRVDREVRTAVIALFQLMGPGVGLPTLRATFPQAARAELEDLKRRFRRLYRKKNRALVCALRWMVPGSVWAIDWTEPPRPVDGIYRYLLVVRDLASGNGLLALPAQRKTAGTAAAALVALFEEHGAPLVLKSDNEFGAEEINRCLQRYEALHLLNPPGLPEYNGACEAGIGALKTRAHYQSARNDRPGEWTCDDVEAARLQANQMHRPWGHQGPTPEEAWNQCEPVTYSLRRTLGAAVAALKPEAREELGLLPNVDLGRWDQAAVMRIAIGRALVALGYLRIRRRRITLPISSRKVAKIS